MMIEIEISTRAYAKLILHSAKYPSSAVNGVLIAKKVGSTLKFVDAVPLFHINLGLAPMLEVALTQVI